MSGCQRRKNIPPFLVTEEYRIVVRKLWCEDGLWVHIDGIWDGREDAFLSEGSKKDLSVGNWQCRQWYLLIRSISHVFALLETSEERIWSHR